jgi:hypothetical protein
MADEIKEEKVDPQDSEWEQQEGAGMWLPETEGEELMGKVEDITEGLYGNQFLIRPLGQEDSIMTPSHKVLQNRMVKVQKGDTVKIVYKGQEPPSVKGQNPTRLYEVFIKK